MAFPPALKKRHDHVQIVLIDRLEEITIKNPNVIVSLNGFSWSRWQTRARQRNHK